jgi:hypothetical protein
MIQVWEGSIGGTNVRWDSSREGPTKGGGDFSAQASEACYV